METFAGRGVVFVCSCAQARKCTLVILGGTIWGQAWGYRERLTNVNFWRSRIQSWSHLCAQHLMPCVTVNKASGNVCWVPLNSTSIKLEGTEFRGLHLWLLCLSYFLPFFTEPLLPPSGVGRYFWGKYLNCSAVSYMLNLVL